MASSREYLDFVLEQLSELDDKEFLATLFNAMVNELPAPKKRKK